MERNTAPFACPIWKHLDLWEEFVRRAVGHYRDRIKYWEILNEPPFFWWYPDAEGVCLPRVNPPRRRAPVWAYADLIKASAPAIRAADPEGRIVVGSGFQDGLFLRRLYEMGCRDSFDVASVHYLPCRHPEDFARGMRRLRQVMGEFGDAEKPLWDTESGPGGAVIGLAVQTPAEYEAVYNIYRHCLAWESGLDRYFWFNPVAAGGAGAAGLPAGGTHDADGRLTPSYQAMKTLTGWVGDGRLVRAGHVGGEVHVYVFEAARGPVSIVWSTAPARGRLPTVAESADYLGEPRSPAGGDTVLSGRPLFLAGDVLGEGFDAEVCGPRETVVACWEDKRERPGAATFRSPRVRFRLGLGAKGWARVPFVARRDAVPVVRPRDHFCQVSSSVAADLQMAHDCEALHLRVRLYDDTADPARPAGLVQFTVKDADPAVREWAYFYNSYALFNLYVCPRGAMLLRFDHLLPDQYPAGRVWTARVEAEGLADGAVVCAAIPWEELGPCRPGRHNPFYMMFSFARCDGLLEVPAGDTPEEWSHNFGDAFIVKEPALARYVEFA